MPRSAPSPRGFTLLEVMIAITLMTSVLLILFTGLRLGMGALGRGNARLEKIEAGFAGTDLLQGQIADAFPTELTQNQTGSGSSMNGNGTNVGLSARTVQVICFRGSARQVRFLSRRSWAGDRSRGIWLAAYQVTDLSDGREQLTISEIAALDSDQVLNALLQDDFIPTRTQTLGDPADHIEFSFWQSSTPSTPGFWTADWKATGQQLLPHGLQIHWQRGGEVETASFVFPVVKDAPK